MKTNNYFQIFAWLLLFSGISIGQPQLYNPIGCRSLAMGNTGYILADDESALFYNPAGLGFSNYRWNGGAFTYHQVPLTEMPGSYYGFAYQDDRIPKFGFAGYVNHFSDEVLEYTSDFTGAIDPNSPIVEKRSDNTFAMGMGYCFQSNDIFDNSAGIGIKYFQENYNDIQSSTIAFDAGYLLRIIKQFRFGIVFRNIGPDYSFHYNDSITSKYPLPLTVVTGIGYSDFFNAGKIRILDISSEISLGKILPKDYDKFFFNSGVETGLFKTLFFRFGYAHPNTITFNGSDEITWGTGVSVFNHFDFDFFTSDYYNSKSMIKPTSSGYSFSFKRGLNWSAKDWTWWRN